MSELDITGGDERKVGYYAGLIVRRSSMFSRPDLGADILAQESLFFATEALFVLQWSRASDYIGRKPVLLIGVAGLAISMLCFGLSKTFVGLIVRYADFNSPCRADTHPQFISRSRCLVGMLNGNIGVIKCMITGKSASR